MKGILNKILTWIKCVFINSEIKNQNDNTFPKIQNREEEVKTNLTLVEQHKKNIDDTIELKKKIISGEAENIKELSQLSNKFGYVKDLYSGITPIQVNSLTDSDFNLLIDPLITLSVTGSTAAVIYTQTQAVYPNLAEQANAISLTDGTTDNTIKSIEIIANSNPGIFPSFGSSTLNFQIVDSLNDDIKFLKSELKNLIPNISNDFDSFIDKFNAFKLDESQYLDLIGARSMVYNKLIFSFVDTNYGRQTTGGNTDRKKYIQKFVFGNAPVLPIADPQITHAKQLYSKLSNQSGRSAKLGNLLLSEVEVQFRDIITSLANIVRLRNAYFQP